MRLIYNEANPRFRALTLPEHTLHHLPINISQPEVTARVVVGQPGMIQPHEMQHGGMDIVDVGLVLDGLRAGRIFDSKNSIPAADSFWARQATAGSSDSTAISVAFMVRPGSR